MIVILRRPRGKRVAVIRGTASSAANGTLRRYVRPAAFQFDPRRPRGSELSIGMSSYRSSTAAARSHGCHGRRKVVEGCGCRSGCRGRDSGSWRRRSLVCGHDGAWKKIRESCRVILNPRELFESASCAKPSLLSKLGPL